jgi:hypothetical protein
MNDTERKPTKPQADDSAPHGDPIGCCKFVNGAGENDCLDGLTQSQCAKIPHSTFVPGRSC